MTDMPQRMQPIRLLMFAAILGTFGCAERYYSSYPSETTHREIVERHVAVRAPAHALPKAHEEEKTALTTPIDGVVGLDERELRERLGTPAAQNDGHPGTTWIYRDTDCSLEVSLYPDVGTHKYKALGYEVTSNARSTAGQHRCAEKYAARVRAD